jgi:hypothetical protein
LSLVHVREPPSAGASPLPRPLIIPLGLPRSSLLCVNNMCCIKADRRDDPGTLQPPFNPQTGVGLGPYKQLCYRVRDRVQKDHSSYGHGTRVSELPPRPFVLWASSRHRPPYRHPPATLATRSTGRDAGEWCRVVTSAQELAHSPGDPDTPTSTTWSTNNNPDTDGHGAGHHRTGPWSIVLASCLHRACIELSAGPPAEPWGIGV